MTRVYLVTEMDGESPKIYRGKKDAWEDYIGRIMKYEETGDWEMQGSYDSYDFSPDCPFPTFWAIMGTTERVGIYAVMQIKLEELELN